MGKGVPGAPGALRLYLFGVTAMANYIAGRESNEERSELIAWLKEDYEVCPRSQVSGYTLLRACADL